ncbi:MAG TPA: C39 family peptidase [Candidatus Acidoferrales bacterium]|nr:C39 family peptidase [Candidatus Acidoferrales bacterium]
MTTKFQRYIFPVVLACAAMVFTGCKTAPHAGKSHFSCFRGQDNFSKYTRSTDADGNTVLLSPEIKSRIPWNELIVSWNADAPAGTYVKIEASALSPGHQTKFYTVAMWSLDNDVTPRTSIRGQKDADGTVDTDTLIVNEPANAAQIRVTLGATNGTSPTLKFLGASFSNTKMPVAARPPNHAAWGKIISTPEHSQHGYPNAKGWCSPTSLSMALSRWADVLHRPEMDLTVPEVAAKVYDTDFAGTGNWPFNTAFAGSFPGMRSYVTRLDDMAEVEDWIAAGIPVILSARWDWLRPGRPLDKDGHLITCIGFTENGDVVINDPAAHLDKGDSVRQIYKRADVIHSWTKSHNAVYLVYPENAKIPRNAYGHWE